MEPSFELRAIVFFAHCGARFPMQDRCRASLQPLESIDDCARGGRVTRLGQLIPQLGYFLVRCAELLFELIDKLAGCP